MVSALPCSPVLAQDARLGALEQEIASQNDRIAELEAIVSRQTALLERIASTGSVYKATEGAAAPALTAPPKKTQSGAGIVAADRTAPSLAVAGLKVSGDLRLREEFNFSDQDSPDRTRAALRARLRVVYDVTPSFSVGAGLATGDPDDPNSTDVALSNFADDFAISLEQAWLRYRRGGFTAYAGKFPQIFLRTDMVWDGDVVPQGIGASYSLALGGDARLTGNAMYFIIDEASGGPDSSMIGLQGVLAAPLSRDLKLTMAGSYFTYRLNSLAGADEGDFRSNLMVGNRYASDFRLIEGIASLSWNGLGERWPLALTGDYVRNLGAAVSSDSGFNIEASVGRAKEQGDWRLSYNYSQVGVDAVFAAFSQDNITIATNYRLHGIGVDYMPVPHLLLNATWYHYRPLDPLYAGVNDPADWLNRVRLSLMLGF